MSCFSIDIILSIPNVVLSPTLDELQQVLSKAARFIIESSNEVKAWNQHRVHIVEREDENGNLLEHTENIPNDLLESWYSTIKNSKDILKNQVVVNGAVNSFREPAANILRHFHEHHELWEGDREALITEFINPQEEGAEPPSLSDMKGEIQKYMDKNRVFKLV